MILGAIAVALGISLMRRGSRGADEEAAQDERGEEGDSSH